MKPLLLEFIERAPDLLTLLKKYYAILLIAASHGAVDFYIGLLAVVAPGLALYLDVPLGDVVFLVGAGTLLCNAVQPVTGWIMGRRNVNWVLSLAVLTSTLPIFMGHVSGIWSLAPLILLGAMGTGIFHPEGALVAHDAGGEGSRMGIPMFMAGGAAFYAIGTPLAIKWTGWFGFPSLAWFVFPGLVIAALLFFQHHQQRRVHPSVMLRPRSKRVTTVADGNMSFWPLLGVAICFGISNGMFVALLASHYELVFGSDARIWAGWTLMMWGIAGSLCSFLWTHLTRRHGFYTVALVTQCLAVPLLCLLAFPVSPILGLVIALPLSMCSPGAVYPVSVAEARGAAGLTQSLRTSITMGGPAGLSSIAIMLSGGLLRGGMSSSYLILIPALGSMIAVVLSVWQIAAVKSRRRGTR